MRTGYIRWLVVGVVGLAYASAGCAPPPPSEEAVLNYVASARFRGKVRRAWPAGQTYLNGVMKVDVVLQRKLAELENVLTPESLWLKGDPLWQDVPALAKHVEALKKLVDDPDAAAADPNQPEDLGKLSRRQLLDALGEAIKRIPDGLSFKSEGGRIDFQHRAWTALAKDGELLRKYVEVVEAAARQRLELHQLVSSGASDFDPVQPGLHVKDAARQARLDAAYDGLRKALEQRRSASVDYAGKQLVRVEGFLRGVDKREEREDYELLSNERKYLRDGLEAVAKLLRKECEAARAALDESTRKLERAAAADKPELKRRVAFCEDTLNDRQARRDALEPRINKFIEQSDAVAQQARTSRND